MAKIKYVQLEPAAFLADFVGLTPAQRGAYTTICFKLYDGAISSDLKNLAILCATTFEDFQNEIWPAISHKFSVSSGLLTHKRVTKELKIAREHHKKRQNAAKKRWSNADAKHKQSYANQNQNQNQKGNSKENQNEKRETKHTHLQFVKLTNKEYESLVKKFGELKAKEWIEELNGAVGSKGYVYKSHYLTILNWARKEKKADRPESCYFTGCDKLGVKWQIEQGKRQWMCPDHLPKEAKKRPPPKRKDPELVQKDKAQEQIAKLAEKMTNR